MVTPARILAIGGFVAGVMGMTGGFVTPYAPTVGPFLIGGANLVMLAANVIVMVRKS